MDQKIIIIGGGAASALLCLALSHQDMKNTKVTVISSDPNFGLGIAYGTGDPHHLLNIPAGKMSAFADWPKDFVTWLLKHPSHKRDRDLAHQFVPRQDYAAYLQESLKGLNPDHFEIIHDTAIGIKKNQNHLIVQCQNTSLTADKIVLATGAGLPSAPLASLTDLTAKQYIDNPWNTKRLQEIDPEARVLVLGTGLTMIDVMLTLQAQKHRGKIMALSRHGLLPLPHLATSLDPADLSQIDFKQPMRGILHQFKKAAKSLTHWQTAMEAIRHQTKEIWQGLSSKDKAIFLRHLRPYWEVHRHRVPAQIHQKIMDLCTQKKLEILSGRLQNSSAEKDGVHVCYQSKGQEKNLTADVIINATGLSGWRHLKIYDDLFTQGLAAGDEFNLGLEVDDHCQILDHTHQAQNIFALGFLTRAKFFEVTSVPDIRLQAQKLAQLLTEKK